MKKQYVKLAFLTALFAGSLLSADAQRGRSRTQRTDTQPQTNTGNQQTTQVNNNQQTTFNAYGNLPIEKAPQTGGFSDTVKRSLRNDAAYERSAMKDRTPLPYEHLRHDDALFSERVWRDIDTREKINQTFNFKMDDDNGNQRFINILVNAIRTGAVTAFSADDDRFTTPLSPDQFEGVLNGGNQCDTTPVYDLIDPTKIVKWVENCNTLNPEDVVKFRIKEDWVFDRESSRMVVRIIGIAPLKTIYTIDKKTEMGAQPLFWIYYPDVRSTLTKYEVYNPKNMGNGRMTWEELFESRMFSSYIVKSTLDNPQNRFIRTYIKDPILALLEGENIKEKIFNYEQDLWSY